MTATLRYSVFATLFLTTASLRKGIEPFEKLGCDYVRHIEMIGIQHYVPARPGGLGRVDHRFLFRIKWIIGADDQEHRHWLLELFNILRYRAETIWVEIGNVDFGCHLQRPL